jgi:CO/xanthine dehydrogenase FAD-binding subunit
MKPPPFKYHAPNTIEEALELMAQLGEEAKLLAGGQSLVPLLNFRLARPKHLIDLNRIPSLAYIQVIDGNLCLGAMTRQRAVERSDTVAKGWPLLHAALPFIGHPQIRNRGTVGGSVAHADPAAELPAVLTALDARFLVRSKSQQRLVAPQEFFVTYFTTTLSPDEMLVEIRIPPQPHGAGWAFQELSRRQGDFALVGVAAVLQLQDGLCSACRIVLAGVGGTPMRASSVEAALQGQKVDHSLISSASRLVVQDIEPPSDVHATSQYRRHVAVVLVERTLKEALSRAQRGNL